MNHRNVVQFFGIHQNVTTRDLYMVLEYMSQGALNKVIANWKDRLSYKDLLLMYVFFLFFVG